MRVIIEVNPENTTDRFTKEELEEFLLHHLQMGQGLSEKNPFFQNPNLPSYIFDYLEVTEE